MAEVKPNEPFALQSWLGRVSEEDRKRLVHVFRFDSHPREFIELMTDLRQRYDFIPRHNPLQKEKNHELA